MIRKKNQFSKVYIEEDPNYTNIYFQKEIYQNIIPPPLGWEPEALERLHSLGQCSGPFIPSESGCLVSPRRVHGQIVHIQSINHPCAFTSAHSTWFDPGREHRRFWGRPGIMRQLLEILYLRLSHILQDSQHSWSLIHCDNQSDNQNICSYTFLVSPERDATSQRTTGVFHVPNWLLWNSFS